MAFRVVTHQVDGTGIRHAASEIGTPAAVLVIDEDGYSVAVASSTGLYRIVGGAPVELADPAATFAQLVAATPPALGTTGATAAAGNDSRLSDARTPLAHNQAWSTITSTPTTLAGYGIGDAAAASHSHAWADITGEPTTLAGYGITDGATDAELAAHEADTTSVHGIANTANLSLVGHTHAPSAITPGSNTQVLTTVAGVAAWASPGGGPGGATVIETVEVDLGSTARRSGRFEIPGTGMTIDAPVSIQQASGPYTGKGTRTDEAEMDHVSVVAKAIADDLIECFWTSRHKVRGNIKFDYFVSG